MRQIQFRTWMVKHTLRVIRHILDYLNLKQLLSDPSLSWDTSHSHFQSKFSTDSDPVLQQNSVVGRSYAGCKNSSEPSFFLLYVGCSSPSWLYVIHLHFLHYRCKCFFKSYQRQIPQDRQCTHKSNTGPAFIQLLLQWRSDKYYIFWVCVCSLRYPARTALAPCYVVYFACLAPPYFSTLHHKPHDFLGGKVIERKIYVSIFSRVISNIT